MDHFELVSEYAPTGDQPQAIEKLVQGFKEGNQAQTLLGVTGSGKTFTMANVIQALNKPTLVIAHIKPSRRSSTGSLRSSSPRTRWNTLSPSVPGQENGGYLVLFDSDLSIFCGGNRTE